MLKSGYCPFCGSEVSVDELDITFTETIWSPCQTSNCRGNRERILTDATGFVIEPLDIQGRYIYSRPKSRNNGR